MASFVSSPLQSPPAARQISAASNPKGLFGVRVLRPRIQVPVLKARSMTVSCAIAQPETLQIVQSTIANQLSIDESTVSPQTKFADLGADSLDTVEIMMALEEKFGVSIGDGGAENISTVQDAADLIEKVKASS